MPRSRTSRAAILAVLALGLSACERGCLMRRTAETRDAARSFDLGGTDCSDGLARCVAGRVETSLGGHVPSPCTAQRERPGTCECAWAPAATCDAGCVEDGIEVVAAPEVARVQLCAPAEPTVRPLSPGELASVAICADEGASCVDGLVRACAARGQPARLLGACVYGCALGIDVEPGDLLTSDGPAGILCRHAHAERR